MRDLFLTERELQVLNGMSRGQSNGQIGRDLYLSEDTIKTHARRLFAKLGARDRAHAVHLAHVAGLLSETSPAQREPLPPRPQVQPTAPVPGVEPKIELRDCSHHIELLTSAFFPGTINRPAARKRAHDGLQRLLGLATS